MLIGIVGIALVASQAVLIRQNMNLKTELEGAASRATRLMEAPPGTKLPALEGNSIGGELVKLPYNTDQRKTLVYVFTPTCPWCERNKPNWTAIAGSIDRSQFRVVGIDLSATVDEEYVRAQGLQLDHLLVKVDPKLIRDYQLTLTPQTLLIDSSGAVERVWTGLYSAEEGSDLKARLRLSVDLPALGPS